MSRSAAGNQSNSLLLRRQLVELTKHPVEGFSAGGFPSPMICFLDPDPLNVQGLVDDDNLYEWEILIIGYVEHIPVVTAAT
jgi:ubiquitin-conjugating enzyme E2 G1